MKHDIYAVKWDDAHYNAGEFEAHEVIHRPWQYTSVGILVQNDETGITLAMDIGEDGRFRGVTFVPRAMVLETWKIGPLTKRRVKEKVVAAAAAPLLS